MSQQLGHTRTVLDATAMGEPVYAAMGYTPTGTAWHTLMQAPAK